MSGFSIRPATAADSGVLSRIHIQGWRDFGAGVVDQTYLSSLGAVQETSAAQKWPGWLQDAQTRTLLACDANNEAAGFVYCGRIKTPIPGQSPIRPLYTGEIYALYILPAYWRRGLGRLLMKEAADTLFALKHRSVCLWVLEGNKRAIDFYKALGGQRCGKKTVDLGGGKYTDVCFGWRSSESLRISS